MGCRQGGSDRGKVRASGSAAAEPEESVSPAVHSARLQVLRRLYLEVQETPDFRSTTARLGHLLPALLEVDRVSLLLLDDSLGKLVVAWSYARKGEPYEGFAPEPQPLSYSISGKALSQGEPVVENDCLNSDLIPPQIAKALQLRSCAAVPVRSSRRLLGVLRLDDMHAAERFHADEVEFLSVVGDLVGLALENSHLTEERTAVRSALQAERNFAAAVLETAGTLTVVADSQGRILRFNRACEELTGRDSAELEGKVLWEALVPAEEADELRFLLCALGRGERCRAAHEGHWTTHTGERRLISWTYTTFTNEEPVARYVIGSGLDITDTRKSEREREIFGRLGLELSAAKSINEIAAVLRRVTEEVWDWDAFHLMVRRSGQVLMKPVLVIDTMGGGKQTLPATGYESSDVLKRGPLKERKPILVNREPGDPGTMARFGDQNRPSASLMYAPVCSGDDILGIISVQSYAFHRFADEDAALLLRMAEAAGPALARAQAEQRGEAFTSLGARLSAARRPEEVGEIAASVADELLGWDAFMLNYFSPVDGAIRAVVNYDVIDGRRQAGSPYEELVPRESLTWRAMHEGPVLLLREKEEKPERFLSFGDQSRPSASLMYVPVRGAGGALGVMSAQSYLHQAYDGNDLVVLEALAQHCAGALERTHVEETLRSNEERYRRIIAGTGAVPYQLDYATNSFVFVGEGIRALIGYSAEEYSTSLMKSIILQVIPYGDAAGLAPGDASRLVRSGELKEWRADIQVRTRSGEVRWLADTSVQIQDKHGHPTGSIGILQDVTERKEAEDALRESEERYRRAITEAGAVPYEKKYADDSFVFVGEGIERITGFPAAGFNAARFREIILESVVHGDGNGITSAQAVPAAQRGELRHGRADLKIRTRSGEIRWLYDSSIQLLDDAGEPRGSLGILQDITERKKAEQALRESEERYALAVQGANDGLWDWDIRSGQIYYSPRWISMLGLSSDQVEGSLSEWLDRVHPEDVQSVRDHLEIHLSGQAPHYESEHRLRHGDGHYLWVLARGVTVRDGGGRAYRMAGSLTDVTARRQAEERLLHGAYHDALTGLPNRAHLTETLSRVLARAARRHDYHFAVLFLDMDRFKVINDSLGHAAGDRFLVEIANRLEQCLRPGDMVARLGGDEFTVLLDDIRDDSDASRVAMKIHEIMKAPCVLDGHKVYSSASIGIALGSAGYSSPEELLRDADTAMYRAKEAGKARSAIFNAEMHASAVERLRLETDLRRALEQTSGFHLHYQPVISLDSREIRGCEALVRWRHPERGLVAPGEFIPMAEETGLIVPLGWWVLERACRQLRSWQQHFPRICPITMSVNLSVAQLRQPDFCAGVEILLEKYEVAPGTLVLEITESQLMSDAESLLEILFRLKRLKIELHVDDFGTGYSSLAYLHRFPIDVLKIDRSFTSRMEEEAGTGEIVRAIISLGHSMNMRVVAEGVETAGQVKLLSEMGCDYGQGYLFSRPADTHAITSLLEKAGNGPRA